MRRFLEGRRGYLEWKAKCHIWRQDILPKWFFHSLLTKSRGSFPHWRPPRRDHLVLDSSYWHAEMQLPSAQGVRRNPQNNSSQMQVQGTWLCWRELCIFTPTSSRVLGKPFWKVLEWKILKFNLRKLAIFCFFFKNIFLYFQWKLFFYNRKLIFL